MNKKQLLPTTAAILIALLNPGAIMPAHSTLLWSADLESYNPGDTVITNNATGQNDTFSAFITSGGAWITPSATLTAQAATTPFATGLYAQALATGGTGSGNLTVRRQNLGSYGTGDVRIFSMDTAKASGTSFSLGVSFINSTSNTLGSFGSITDASIPSSSLIRVTAVYNQSGSSILLPGSLGSLATGNGILYYQTGGAYTLVGSNTVTTGGTGFQFAWSSVGVPEAGLFDNLGFWSSASDTLNGVNVLALAPGAAVPEPSTVTMLSFGGILAFFFFRRSRRFTSGQ